MIDFIVRYATTPYSIWKLVGLVGMMVFFVLMPSFAHKMAGRIAHGWLADVADIQHKFMMALDVFFAIHVMSMFVMLYMVTVCAYQMIVPMLISSPLFENMDAPLTARVALCWVVFIGLPLFCFKHIAMPSLRDTNQVMNGQYDRLRHLRSGGTLKGGPRSPAGNGRQKERV